MAIVVLPLRVTLPVPVEKVVAPVWLKLPVAVIPPPSAIVNTALPLSWATKMFPVELELLTVRASPLVKPVIVVVPVRPIVEADSTAMAPAALLPMFTAPVDDPVFMLVAKLDEALRDTAAPEIVAPKSPCTKPSTSKAPSTYKSSSELAVPGVPLSPIRT